VGSFEVVPVIIFINGPVIGGPTFQYCRPHGYSSQSLRAALDDLIL